MAARGDRRIVCGDDGRRLVPEAKSDGCTMVSRPFSAAKAHGGERWDQGERFKAAYG